MFMKIAIGLALNTAVFVNAAKTLKVPFTSSLIQNTLSTVTEALKLDANEPSVASNNAVLKVVVPVQAGNGQTFNDVLVDTGSAILWVGGEAAYVPGPSSHTDNLTTFSVGYGAGGVGGNAYYDKVTIGEATVSTQIIGAANQTSGFTLVKPIDGILGLGPSGSNTGEVAGFTTTPTFVENLVSEGTISEAVFGIHVSGVDSMTGMQMGQGEITFGGVDEDKIAGDMTWIPQNPPYNFHWEFNVSSFNWGTQQLLNTTSFARTDTGVLPIGLPFDTFFEIFHSTSGATFVSNGTLAGYLAFAPNATADTLPPLSFVLGAQPDGSGGQTFDIPASKYLVPLALYPSLGLEQGTAVYSWIASAGQGSFMFGQKWLESFYTAYDMQNRQVGFAHLA